MHIRLATETDVEPLTHLFDLYRQSLGQASQLVQCRQFIASRLNENDTMIFMASNGPRALGFLQLYPSYSSLLLSPIWYFDDVFVIEEYRGTGVAKALINNAKRLADSADVIMVKRTLVTEDIAKIPQAFATSDEDSSHGTLYMYHKAV